MQRIASLSALEILDSRARPTIEVRCGLEDGTVARAQVPSGASRGAAEAVELRDGDPDRYRGLGCLQAAANVAGPIAKALTGTRLDQRQLDQALIELDGTANKSNLGANALLGVSLAFARASANSLQVPLYEYFASLIERPAEVLPRLTVNLFSGGKHAGGQVPLQDVLIVPARATSIAQGLEQIVATYEAAADLIAKRYNARRLTADEGGLAPPFNSVREMFDTSVAAIEAAGLKPGRDIALAVDVAASHFYTDGKYYFGETPLDPPGMIEALVDLVENYPIVSLEDGLAEDDWSHWPKLCAHIKRQALTLGDDLLCTNPQRITRAAETGACNALLLKANQIGTLTEAAQAYKLARDAGWKVTVSARSGETEDDWLADLAVGWAGDQIKVGSVSQSERLAKYNRLLTIENETGRPVAPWPQPQLHREIRGR